MAITPLTAAFVRSAPPGRYCDGDGLYLLVKKTGARYWVFRFRVNGGKPREYGLGRAGEGRNAKKLAQAREEASALFRQVKVGTDPLAARDAALAAARAAEQEASINGITFREASQRYVENHKSAWRNPKHAGQWTSTLDNYAWPFFGEIPVRDITTEHVLAALEPIWSKIPETASRLRGRIEAILDFGKARGWRSGENPARWKAHLALILPARSKVASVKHHPALPWPEIGPFMQKLQGQSGTGARALQFAILTCARSAEVREAPWSEIDLENAIWLIPAVRMKGGREHRVPLSETALKILHEMRAARTLENPHALVFPGQSGDGPLSDMTLTAVLKRMSRHDVTVHGFRSTFRDWVAELTAHPADLAEMALAHKIPVRVEASYRRGDMFMKRRQLMADWADYCGQCANSDDGADIAQRAVTNDKT